MRLLYRREMLVAGGVASLAMPALGQDDPLRHGHALLIGVWNYVDRSWQRLDDIQLQIEQLRLGLSPHFDDVATLLNPKTDRLRGELLDFLARRGNDPTARLLVYYAGHGFTETSLTRNTHRGFITGADTPYAATAGQIAAARAQAISMDAIRSMVADIDARHVLFVFDSCFAGTVFTARSASVPPSLSSTDISGLMQYQVRQFITAGDANERVPAHSPIPDLLLAALRGDADESHLGIVTGQQLGWYLFTRTRGTGLTPREGKLPEPFFSRGEFLFRVATATPLSTAALVGISPRAVGKVIKVGINLSLTGADSPGANRVKNAIVMAFDTANEGSAVPGYRFELLVMDDGTAVAGQYDPAQAANNARRLVADKEVVAALGPQMSGAGKAMTPILSQGGLATITPSSTNPDITNPKFAAQYRPAGKPIYFRTVTTDAYQGPNMANFFAEVLKVKSVYVLDDSGMFGIGVADAFQKQAEAKGIKVVGRDRLDPAASDYTAVLTKIKTVNPDSLYYGGVSQAGVKLAKQAYDIIPKVIKGGSDGVYGSYFLGDAGFPAVEGWYTTIAAPHLVDDTKAAQFVEAFRSRFGEWPDDYAITAYDAALVIIDSVKRVAMSGKPITREAVRDAIQTARVPTIQGIVSFDANGDLADRTVSVFQVRKDATKPLTDVSAQYKYIGVAPQS